MSKTRSKKALKEMEKHAGEETKRSCVEAMLPLLTALSGTRGDLLELCVKAGLQTLEVMLEAERERLCGARRSEQTSERTAYRGGTTPGKVVLGGRKVSIRVPRVRGLDGEAPLATYQHYAENEVLDDRTLEQLMVGVSTRKYDRSLESMGEIEESATSKSAVSRRFVALTAAQLGETMSASLKKLDLVTVMLDGLEFGEHLVVLGLGIDAQGHKHALGLWDGSTENEAVCTGLLSNLVERGLRTDRTTLFVLDGGKALSKAVRKFFHHKALIQRCQVHKVRNVVEHLPEHRRGHVKAAMQEAYRCEKPETARRLLNALARQLEVEHPGAAASLREGLAETLTVLELQLPDRLRRTLSTTNPVENLNSLVRHATRNVKRWRSGKMVLRWVGAALRDASRSFRRVRGCGSMEKLVAALRARDTDTSQKRVEAA